MRSLPLAPRDHRSLRRARSHGPVTGAECRRRAKKRMAVFVAFVLLAVSGIGARLVDLQVLGRQRYVSYGLQQRQGFELLPAGRGAIFDRDGQAFAMSVAEPQVVADPQQVPEALVGSMATHLAALLGVDRGAIEGSLQAHHLQYRILAPTVSAVVAGQVMKLKYPGISLEDKYVRNYPSGSLGGSLVGRALADGQVEQGSSHQGIYGMERQYDVLLHGTPGRRYYDKDPAGGTIAGGVKRVVDPRPGTDLYLTLDQSLQYQTEQALAAQVNATGAQGAMAVIMRPSTGEILSMASVGRKADNTVSGTVDAQPITSVFEPGSVNKMITIAGALEDRVDTPTTVHQVPDQLKLYDRTFNDDTTHPTNGWSTTDVLVKSSNIGTIQIAESMGKVRVDHYLRAFGFGSMTGLGFQGETAGIVRPVSQWSGVDIGAVPIGQGMGVTALQMLLAYNVIANDGMYVAPKLVSATDAGHGRTPTPASVQRRVVSPDTARAMRAMLDKVVTDGTGKLAAVPGYSIGGKTGTARIPQWPHELNNGYADLGGHYHYQSSFVGVVDGADLSIIVSLRDSTSSIFGGDVAAPVFAELAANALRLFQIPPPALLQQSRLFVPALSPSARPTGQEDVTVAPPAAAG